MYLYVFVCSDLMAGDEKFYIFYHFFVFDKFRKYISVSNISPIHITKFLLYKFNFVMWIGDMLDTLMYFLNLSKTKKL